ncbi:hypothetical protein HBH56_119350 [Parastagonospora nodorum]|uniref:Uncharacterized protein n=1 Tax=Phaeosphaeria nodorum (strain SN15 / ATCC MYA-4574 / FGSC 10173) TaxID=321614 RepID=A0A7U2I8U0_PHANO|nr:hypothetical protein HBH56_119350 [Parastagonospora nodorum]QRD05367.1 hypothetical protein JI435_422340 [Parastagonospora nodorum SN15]KAH3929130.1 hypothetical protein HBH54_129840 [Parastagonospora nodorum]KAH4104298.1 hypothetical protein HBH46_102850 [Parastagonospora nodorum]KAH4136605.1 hypothetical protein HBH45_135110 [Parastagonospora nodorum]
MACEGPVNFSHLARFLEAWLGLLHEADRIWHGYQKFAFFPLFADIGFSSNVFQR